MIKKYRAGIIGLGRIGFTLGFDKKREQPSSHSRALSESRRIIVDGGFDIDPLKSRAWGKHFKRAKVYSTAEEMLADGVWDIIVIAVPEEHHLQVFRKVVGTRPGLIVLEKPVAPTIKEALYIKQESQQYEVPVLVNHERRFSRDYLLMKRILSGMVLGKPLIINSSLFTSSPAWMGGDEMKGKGALVSDGTHLFDTVSFLLGERPFMRHAEAYGLDKNGNIAGLSCLGSTMGIDTVFNIGYGAEHFTFEIDLICKKGRARIGNGLFEISVSKSSPFYEGFFSLIRETRYKPFRRTGCFSAMTANCIEFLDGTAPLHSTLDDGIGALLSIEEIKEILRGQGIKLN